MNPSSFSLNEAEKDLGVYITNFDGIDPKYDLATVDMVSDDTDGILLVVNLSGFAVALPVGNTQAKTPIFHKLNIEGLPAICHFL